MFRALDGRRAADRLLAILWTALLALFVLGAIGLIGALVNPARAQDAVRSTVVDFGPAIADLLIYLAPTILSVAGLLGVWVLQRLGSVLKLKIDAGHRAAIEQALHHAIGFAIEKLGDKAKGGIPIDLKSDGLAVAVNYAQRSIPGAIGYFGISDERLQEMVESRMEGVLFDPSADEVSERVEPSGLSKETIYGIRTRILSPGAL